MSKNSTRWIILIILAVLLACLLWSHYNTYGSIMPGVSFSNAPNASTYSGIFYGLFNPNNNTRPPIPETAFDTKA